MFSPIPVSPSNSAGAVASLPPSTLQPGQVEENGAGRLQKRCVPCRIPSLGVLCLKTITDGHTFDQPKADLMLRTFQQDHCLEAAIGALHNSVVMTGHVAPSWKEDMTYFDFGPNRYGTPFRGMINHARSKYSLNHRQKVAECKYPCKLCYENVADPDNPANTNLRAFHLELNGHPYFMQTPPYPYVDQHSLLLSKAHHPMCHDRSSVQDHIAFLNLAPSFVVCQNSDIYGAGATIPEHHHVPLMKNLHLPVMEARPLPNHHRRVGTVDVNVLDYPFTAVRFSSENADEMSRMLSDFIAQWRADENVAEGQKPGRTANYVLKKDGGKYVAWVFLRDVKLQPADEYNFIKPEYSGYIDIGGNILMADKTDATVQEKRKQLLQDNAYMTRVVEEGLKSLSSLSAGEALTRIGKLEV